MQRHGAATTESQILICGIAKDAMPYLRAYLENSGKKVELCSSPAALEIRLKKPDTCLVVMVWEEGKPLWIPALRLLGQEGDDNCRLLMAVTPSKEAFEAARHLGAHDVILSPFQKEELLFRLDSLQNRLDLSRRLKLGDPLSPEKTAGVEAKFLHMLGRLAHDLNTPLAAAYMGCDLLMTQRDELTPPVRQKITEQISFSLGELKRALAAVGYWVSLTQGRLKPNLLPLQLKELLEAKKEDWAELETMARRDQKKILLEIPSVLPSVLADKELIAKVILLLMNNSLYYTAKGDQIKIKVTEDEKKENLVFTIEDTGQNIPSNLGEMIFEWGISREEHLRGLRWGRGIGLNFCKQAVEVCGGHIWAESQGERGCKFGITLPISQ